MDNLDLKIIQDEVEREFGFKIIFNSRKRQHVYARSICFYLAREYTKLSLSKIGIFYGKKDHATVMHGCRKSENDYVLIPNYRAKLLKIINNVSDFFPKRNNRELIKEAHNYSEALMKAENYRKLYLEQLEENERLKTLIETKSITNVDVLVSKLDPNELDELKQFRIIPFLKMRGKLKPTA